MALAWHRRMLGYAHDGLGQRRGFDPCFIIHCFGDVRFDSANCICAYREVQYATQSETTIHIVSIIAHSGYKSVCLALWLEVCSNLKSLTSFSKT